MNDIKPSATLERMQDIIRTANQEGFGRPYTLTFLYMWGFFTNSLNLPQEELSARTGVDPRTLRSHLKALNDAGWISYDGAPTSNKPKNITIKRFRH